MMIIEKIGYFFKQGMRNASKSKGTTAGAIVTICLSLILIGLFSIMDSTINNIIHNVESQINITVYLSDDYTQSDDQSKLDKVTQLENQISQLDGVEKISYTNKEQAMADFKETMSSEDTSYIDTLDENPLPESIEVQLYDAHDSEKVADEISDMDLFKEICDEPDNPQSSIRYGKNTVDRILSLTSTVRYVSFVLIIALLVTAFLFVANSIRLAIINRSDDITTQRLVGSSNAFIRGPFIAESLIQSIIGSGIAIASIEIIRISVVSNIASTLPWLPIDANASTYAPMYVFLFVFGIAIGLVSAILAMQKYLKI